MYLYKYRTVLMDLEFPPIRCDYSSVFLREWSKESIEYHDVLSTSILEILGISNFYEDHFAP